VTVEDTSPGSTVPGAGPLADLWEHTADPNNVMADQGGGTADQLTPWQCCMIRTSRFACFRNLDRFTDVTTAVVFPGTPI